MNRAAKRDSKELRSYINEITVAGFKSIAEERTIEIRPLTILAGVNSSGKSSMIQPLLLLKQTLESTYDPGTLLLNGPNVKFTSAEQLLSRIGKRRSSDIFQVGMRLNTTHSFQTTFRKEHKFGFRIEQMDITDGSRSVTLSPDMTLDEILETGVTLGKDPPRELPEQYKQGKWGIRQARCFLAPEWVVHQASAPTMSTKTSLHLSENPAEVWERIIPEVLHLPGLRGNPERTYPVTAVGPTYPGTFEKYTASLVSQWVEQKAQSLADVNADLKLLRLTGGVTAFRPNGVQLELHVGRLPDLPPNRPEDRVNIVDVGIGVSQTLPVLVALHAAEPGQLVYIEQPEAHLHPRAQFALARMFAAAANRSVRVVIETHSSALLLGVQTLVAKGKLEPDKVKLHWFQREKDGRTTVHGGELDEAGRFGDWPADFDDIALETQKAYLDAADERLFAHEQKKN